MNVKDFLEKAENEGFFYAVTEYGLTQMDLDEELAQTPFFNAVKILVKKANEVADIIEQLSDGTWDENGMREKSE